MKMLRNYLLASVMLLGSMPAARAAILTNGSFEGTVSPWVTTGGIGTSSIGSGQATDGGSIALIGFPGISVGKLSQSFTLSSGGLFDFAFNAGRSEGFCACQDVPLTFSVSIDGVVLSSVLPDFYGPDAGSATALKLVSTYAGTVSLAAGTHEFAFNFSRGETLFGRNPYIGIDGVSLTAQQVNAVPEPSTWAMMLLGFAGIGYGVYRRKKAAAATLAA
jgi:PEP-CTERM motif